MSATPALARRRVSQRIRAIMMHTTRYAFDGVSRLAQDIGVTPSGLYRILNGKRRPSFSLMMALTEALERELGRTLDPRELMTFSGTFPTPEVCTLCGCRGCLPDEAYQADGTLKPAYRHVAPGTWSGDERQPLPPGVPPKRRREGA